MKRSPTILSMIVCMLSFTAASTLWANSCTDTCDSDNQCNLRNSCSDCSDCDTRCTSTTSISCAQNCRSLLLTRSAHDNTARRYLPFEHMADMCEFNGGFSLGYEFTQTFKGADLSRCLFGRKNLSFKGSQVVGRNAETDLIADYFGLSPFFVGSLPLCPQVQSQNLFLESYFGLDGCVEGLYFRLDLTFAHQKRELLDNNCSACPTSTVLTNTTPFPAGYMANGTAAAATSLLPALNGTFLFGDMQTPWKFGRFSACSLSDNKVAGFSIDFGYDFWRCEDSHLGIFLRYSAPTGTKLDGSEAFSNNIFFPIIGNGHHHELGGGLTAHAEIWSNECGDNIVFYLDGYATHLFEDCQIRSFDFAGAGCLSRYMLLKELTPTGNSTTQYAYNGSLINAINFTTRNVKSTIDVQGDASLRLIYNHQGFSLAIGYNIFGREEEKLCLKPGIPCKAIDPNATYGFKGCEGVYYYCYPLVGGGISVTSGAATATQQNSTASNATAYSCGTPDSAVPAGTATGTGPFCVDWKNPLYGLPALQANALPLGTPTTTLVQAHSSAPARAIDSDDMASVLNIRSGRLARLLSNKGFLALGYEWDGCNWSPFINAGVEVEGGGDCCDVKQWGVWLKGGFSF